MKRRLTFTIYHGLIASLAIHAALSAPFVLERLTPPPDEPEILTLNLQGLTANRQDDEKVLQETKNKESEDKTERTKPQEQPKEVAAPPPPPQPEEKETPVEKAERVAAREVPPPEQKAEPKLEQKVEQKSQETKPVQSSAASHAGMNNATGETQRQEARTIRMDQDTEANRIKAYIRLLSKKVQAKLVYPDNAIGARLVGISTVSFTILPSGDIRSNTLRIVTSSGQPKLDAGALKTIAASVPFDPPPREITISIGVEFERER